MRLHSPVANGCALHDLEPDDELLADPAAPLGSRSAIMSVINSFAAAVELELGNAVGPGVGAGVSAGIY